MPELPEVETIRRNLRKGSQETPPLLGLKIAGGEVLWQRTLASPSIEEFRRRLPGQVIREIGRRGKFLVLYLTEDALIIHLRMSGDLWVESQEIPLSPHHRAFINMQGGIRLAFNDARKFGRLWLVKDPQDVLALLGPEPLDEDFTAQDLYARLQKYRRHLKPLLLDQSFLAGIGNIYADESLHQAKLHPLMVSNQVSGQQAGRLWESIRVVLEQGIQRSGASIDWVYRGGDFQNYFRVYRRTGEPCWDCGTLIERIVVGQRGTHYCPQCQRLDEPML